MPDNAAAPVALRLQGKLNPLACPSNCTELMIAADLLDNAARALVLLEDDARRYLDVCS
jgi:hypothetical protein